MTRLCLFALALLLAPTMACAQQPILFPTERQVLIVVDSHDKFVGILSSQGSIIRKVKGEWILINSGTKAVTREGFVQIPATSFIFFHESLDCSGPRYLNVEQLPRTGRIDPTDTLYFPGNSIEFIPGTNLSAENFVPGQTLADHGANCQKGQLIDQGFFGLVETFDLNTLGLTPPFSVR